MLLEVLGELTTHIAVESNLVYPAARRAAKQAFPEGSALHGRMRDVLSELASPGISGESFARKAEELSTAFAAHAIHDENAVYPALVRRLEASALEELGEDVERLSAALFARSRPYLRPASDDPRAA